MRVLVCGADGFLGRHLEAMLAARGHTVLRGVRRPRAASDIRVDYDEDLDAARWLPRLAGVDAVVNAVGILRERKPGDFERVHHRAPAALFEACAVAGVHRVVQISALGAPGGGTEYLASKARGDAALLRRVPQGVVLRPALVFGADGASARFFVGLASVPLHALPRGCPVQPVHVDDLVELAVRVLEDGAGGRREIDVPGPRALPFAELLATYRRALGLAPALRLPLPGWLMAAAARIAGRFPSSLLSGDTWAMLAAGNVGDAGPTQALLGRPLRAPEAFILPQAARAQRHDALAGWRGPLLRAVLAAVWALTACVSAFAFPQSESLALLAAFGLQGGLAQAVLWGAIALDAAMALLTVLRPGRRLWLAQLLLIAAYSALIAWRLPEFLIHPFGPILKNLAVAALLVQLWAEETNR